MADNPLNPGVKASETKGTGIKPDSTAFQTSRTFAVEATKAFVGLAGSIDSSDSSLSTFTSQMLHATLLTNKLTSGIIELAAGTIKLGSSFNEYKKQLTEVSRATASFGEQNESLMGAYVGSTQKAMSQTGKSFGDISKEMGTYFKSASYLADSASGRVTDGFDKQSTAANRAEKQLGLYGRTIQTTRTIGLDAGEAFGTMKDALQGQGIAGDKTVDSFVRLRKHIQGTGADVNDVVGNFRSMTQQFGYNRFNTDTATASFGQMAKAQRQLADEGKETFASQKQAGDSLTTAFKGAVSAQRDFGQALFYASVQGGNLSDAIDFMWEDDPTKTIKAMAESIEDLTGSKLLTRQQARATGQDETFMLQQQQMQKRLGFTSPQESSKFTQAWQTGQIQQAAQIAKDQKVGQKELNNEVIKQDGDFYKKMYSQGEISNAYLNQLTVNTAVTASSFLGKVGGATQTAGQGINKATEVYEKAKEKFSKNTADLKAKQELDTATSNLQKEYEKTKNATKEQASAFAKQMDNQAVTGLKKGQAEETASSEAALSSIPTTAAALVSPAAAIATPLSSIPTTATSASIPTTAAALVSPAAAIATPLSSIPTTATSAEAPIAPPPEEIKSKEIPTPSSRVLSTIPEIKPPAPKLEQVGGASVVSGVDKKSMPLDFYRDKEVENVSRDILKTSPVGRAVQKNEGSTSSTSTSGSGGETKPTGEAPSASTSPAGTKETPGPSNFNVQVFVSVDGKDIPGKVTKTDVKEMINKNTSRSTAQRNS